MTRRSRYAPAALVAGLLVATAVAFVITERLKLSPSPIRGPIAVTPVFSPDCECTTDVASISFVLRRRDILDVEIVGSDGEVVRELVRGSARRQGRVTVYWNGRIDSGARAEEGVYRPRVHLDRNRRTILMRNRIRVDATPPTIVLVSVSPLAISPDGDGRRDRVAAEYRVDERARVALFVDGDRQTLRRGSAQKGRIEWNGRVSGVPVDPGTYGVTLGAVDLAGNVGRPTRAVPVSVRYVALGRSLIRARPSEIVDVRVVADARSFTWKLAKRSGRAATGRLRLRAPAVPGRYNLVVSVGGRSARATVVVRRPAR
ncbi:MAG: hypothetical protein FJW96_01020 [Actinobacteria bacterium]|nr:hypothetical protein [Actinomycetota bacterium]